MGEKEKVVRQLALFVGEPKYVDKASLAKQNWVRVRVGIKKPSLGGGSEQRVHQRTGFSHQMGN